MAEEQNVFEQMVCKSTSSNVRLIFPARNTENAHKLYPNNS